ANKVYDGTTAATIGGTAYVAALGTDTVSVSGSGSGDFLDKNAGTGKAVIVNIGGYALGGTDAGNYNLAQPVGVKANITKRVLTSTGAPIAASRVYDGTLTTSISGAALAGVLGTDIVNLGGLFADKNAGVAKSVSLTTTGNDSGNYSVAPVAGLTANITQLALTVSGTPIAASRVYDGKVATTVSGASLDGVLGADSVILGGNFADKNAGTGKAVSLVLTGTAGANYSIAPIPGITANITKRDLTITAFGVSRIYNAGTAATVNLANNRVSGDILTTGYSSAAFLDKNVGTDKTINVSGITLGGADAGNYAFNTTATATASISKLNIALKGVTAANKVYDGTTAATIGGTAYVSALGTDSVIVQNLPHILVYGSDAAFLDQNAGTGKAVIVNMDFYALSGTDAGNYNLTQPIGVKANITPRSLSVAADNQSMPFGSSLPALTYTVGGLGLVGGDTMASVFSGGLSTLASSTSAIGPYSITRGTLATNSNYTITTYVNGVLTIQ
ncbi:MAG: YDG domain-containing protein, partial [Gallionella sp.]